MFWHTLYYAILIFLGDAAICAALYLVQYSYEDKTSYLNPKPTDIRPTSIFTKQPKPKSKRRSKLSGAVANSHIISIIKGSL